MSKIIAAASAAAIMIASAGAVVIGEPLSAAVGDAVRSSSPAADAAPLPPLASVEPLATVTTTEPLPAGSAPVERAPAELPTEGVTPPPAPSATAPLTTPVKAKRAGSLAQAVLDHVGADVSDPQLRCLATTVYFEAKSESLTGQLAVAKVVLNRAKSGRFASTPCGVMNQRNQFSFVRDGRTPAIPTASRDWREAVAIAKIAITNAWDNPVPGALFFHAAHVSPGWKLTRLARVDNHIFYR